MSAHAGIYHRDGAPASVSELAICLPFLDRLGPEGGGDYADGRAAFVHRIYHVTPESFAERQPYAGRHVSTWDGRLDNRDDLLLQLRDSPPADLSDAAYAHAAFGRWGFAAFPRLLGEWGMAVWSPIPRELCLARDHSGASPLYYYLTGRLLIWSSELEAVVAIAKENGLPLTIDEGWIAGFLARGPEPAETPYREIRAVEAGHYIQIGTDSFSNRRHTFLDTRTRIGYRTDAEYEEHFRHLFEQAVACRLRCVGKVFAHLSGGLDSSSVAAMAAHIVRSGGSSAEVETLSSVYSDTPASDESEYIELMENWLGLPAHRISESDYPALTPPDLDFEPASPSCIDIFADSQKAVRQSMEIAGARVQLSGEGGDELLGNAVNWVPQLRDLLQSGSWSTAPNVLLRWSLASKQTQWRLAYEVLLSMLPDGLASKIEVEPGIRQVGYLLALDFVRRTQFLSRLHEDHDPFGFLGFSQRMRSVAAASVVHKISSCPWRRIGPMAPVYPMMDRRLVNFLLAIPIEQLARPGSRRSLHRRAMRNLLPPKLLMRRSKKSPDAALYRRVVANWERIESAFESPIICREGIVDEERLRTALEQVRRGSFPVTLILSPLQIELWLRRSAEASRSQRCGPATLILREKEVRI